MVTKFLAATACMALVAACAMGGAKQSMQAAPVSSTDTRAGAAMPGENSHSDIERLSAEIDAQRTKLGLPEPQMSSTQSPAAPMATVPLSSDASCRPSKTDRCTQSCSFSDSICTNAGKICDIAAQLTADTWAADKCSRAKQTCDAAHDSCCSCQ